MTLVITRNPNLDLSNITDDEAVWHQSLKEEADTGLLGPRPHWWWTGKPPVHGLCPGVQADGSLSSLPLTDL